MNRGRRISLRIKWMALISGAVLVSVLGSTLMLFYTARASLEATFSEGNAVQVESAAREIRAWTGKYEQAVRQLARSIEFASVQAADPGAAIGQLLQAAQEDDALLASVYFISAATGRMQASSGFAEAGDARTEEVYRLAAAGGGAVWTDVRRHERHGRMVMSVAAPVLVGGELYGIAGFDMDLQAIGSLRKSNERFGGNKLVIYDSRGVIISSFMDGLDGRNLDPAASGQMEDALPDREQMAETFAWVKEIAEGKRRGIGFSWEGVDYNGEVSFVYALDWTIVSFVDKQALHSQWRTFLAISFIAAFVGLCIGACAAYWIASRLLKTIGEIRSAISRTAAGDLTAEIRYNGNDEMGELAGSYNAMLASVRGLIMKVRGSVREVEDTAKEVKATAEANEAAGRETAGSTAEIAAGAAHTAEEAERSSAAVDRLSGAIGVLIGQSREVEAAIAATGSHIENGRRQAGQLEEVYTSLDQALGQVTAIAADLSEKSRSISSVTKIIADISEQTNLLSINASIEAARAGEHGKGFAAVASEVRRLAEQAKRSSQNIYQTIMEILAQTGQMVAVVQETNAVNQTQKQAVAQVSQAMRSMHEALERMLRMIEQEVAAIAGVEGLRDAVVASTQNILAVCEQTTARTEAIASSTEAQIGAVRAASEQAGRLEAAVAELRQAVSRFRVDGDSAGL